LRIIKDKAKKNKIYGFVIFSSQDGYDSALQKLKKHRINGIKIDCKPSLLKEDLKKLKKKKKLDEKYTKSKSRTKGSLKLDAEPFSLSTAGTRQSEELENNRRDAVLSSIFLESLHMDQSLGLAIDQDDKLTQSTQIKEQASETFQNNGFNFSKFNIATTQHSYRNSNLTGYSQNAQKGMLEIPHSIFQTRSREASQQKDLEYEIRQRMSKTINPQERDAECEQDLTILHTLNTSIISSGDEEDLEFNGLYFNLKSSDDLLSQI